MVDVSGNSESISSCTVRRLICVKESRYMANDLALLFVTAGNRSGQFQ